jgi:hypothetical protein
MSKYTIKTIRNINNIDNILNLPCVLEQGDIVSSALQSSSRQGTSSIPLKFDKSPSPQFHRKDINSEFPVVKLDFYSVKEPLMNEDKKELYDRIRLFFNQNITNSDIENAVHTFFEQAISIHSLNPLKRDSRIGLGQESKYRLNPHKLFLQLFSSSKPNSWRVKELGSSFLIELNEIIKTNTFNFDAFSGYENIKIILNDNYLTVFQAKKLNIDESTARVLYNHLSYLILSKKEPVIYGSNNIISHFCKILGCNFYEYVEDGIIVI